MAAAAAVTEEEQPGRGTTATAGGVVCLRHISQLVRVACAEEGPERKRCGGVCGKEQMNQLHIIEDGALVVDRHGGRIVFSGQDKDLPVEWHTEQAGVEILDLKMSRAVIPGLVDAHTHPVWGGDRCFEFALKLEGASYMDLHARGGGIGYTVGKTQQASEEELRKLLLQRLDRMVAQGTTVCEAKSGYGLDKDTELKMLRVLHKVAHPVSISATYLGAHSVPQRCVDAVLAKGEGNGADKEKVKEAAAWMYVDEIVNEHIPAMKEAIGRDEISPSNVDVFLENGVFNADQTDKVLAAGKEQLGLHMNFHGDELSAQRSGELAQKWGARAVSHLEEISDKDIQAMAEAGVYAVLLPTTAYVLRITPPPARALIDRGVPVCLGSDFNPNAHCLSMPFVMNLACVNMKMTMPEALVAATINSAGSIGLESDYGSLEVGKYGNFVIVDHPNWEHLVYEIADPPIHSVYVAGKKCYPRDGLASETIASLKGM
eukprot:Nk52_evm6s526 gene=Nk52_evmTU6s526